MSAEKAASSARLPPGAAKKPVSATKKTNATAIRLKSMMEGHNNYFRRVRPHNNATIGYDLPWIFDEFNRPSTDM